MKKKILTACALLLGSIVTMTAQVKLQSSNVDEVLKAMTLEEKAMLVVGGNRQTASTGNNGMIGSPAWARRWCSSMSAPPLAALKSLPAS